MLGGENLVEFCRGSAVECLLDTGSWLTAVLFGWLTQLAPSARQLRGVARYCENLAGQPHIKVLQCSSPVRDAVWVLLNEHLFAVRPDVELRVYGHYSTECDLSFARAMTNVRRFAADCLMRAKNVEAIAAIPCLESLSLGSLS